MTILTAERDIVKLRETGKILKGIFAVAEEMIKAGVSTADLSREIEKIIRERGAEPAFKGYRGYPAAICASVNEVVVHGIPSEDTVLVDGDIIGVDIGVRMNGYYSDAAKTFAVGEVSDEAKQLIDVTKRCLSEGIKQAVTGNRVFDISNVIQNIALDEGYEEVRAFVGHGIGKNLHEAPEVPNWGEKGKGPLLEEGLLLAIEPMINAGTRDVKILPDEWTAVTRDGKLSAHFEHTVIVGKEAEIIT